jgi:hypothetical protein
LSERSPLCSRLHATRAAAAIIGSFRRNDADDAEVLVAAFVRILSAYPEAIVREAADPLTGIAGKQTFLPSPAELKADLDARVDRDAARVRRERMLEEQLRARREDSARAAGVTAEERERAVAYWAQERAEMAVAEMQAKRKARRALDAMLAEPLPKLSPAIIESTLAKMVAE